MAKKRRKLTLKPGQPEQSSTITDAWQKQASLLMMPLEIIFEVCVHRFTSNQMVLIHIQILGYLLPRELVALSRTNKALRETIYSQGMAIWRSARMAVGAPECAPGFSERQWAILLFGGPTCGTCGIRDAPNITFSFLRRVCGICMRMNFISLTNFTKKFPDYDRMVFDMAPYTWVEELQAEFCWVSDLERIGKKWKRLKAGVDRGVRGAGEKLEAYQDEMDNELDRIMQVSCRLGNDMGIQPETHKERGGGEAESAISRVCGEHVQLTKAQLHCSIRERLVALGYEEQDIPDHMLSDPQLHVGERSLKDVLWASIRPGLVTEVKAIRDDRLVREEDALHDARMNMFEPLYDAYAQSLPPRQWTYLPDIRELISHPRFNDIVDADSDANITQSSFLPAAAELPTLIPAVISVTKAAATSLLGPVDVEIDEPLDLATSVFEHNFFSYYQGPPDQDTEKLALISWDVVAAHACRVDFSNKGSAAATMLVRAAGLDPLCATNTEMDALDLRFACRECTARGPLNPKVGYPWKPAWQEMSQEDTVRIKQAETYNEDNSRSWSCNHCTAYFKSPDTKPRVVQHLNDAHGIVSPTEPGDIFWYSKHRRHSSSPALASLDITPRRSKRKRRTAHQ
ncbi:hypothetical protein BD779DRAFT_1790678 [Infundibulicybe gibba]|nr:hypothetical protein BD779DRAFT_1790678 [Infundibulicybe gibba]